ncbi:glycosyltransferase family 2 protein [Erythrobacter sp. EC-HK427]|uniref:glycosyltransferase family 2 protein n=1 Tax=Erythrobacter sp. EC-HK427 TaxID=2038396 RepID=UPI00125C9442|nr:glycosyltransferase [Erythrobacter sp. EC-HK427]VVT07116.1 conserved hypothetical protein [Erythrobacter sp. EC-HK427]
MTGAISNPCGTLPQAAPAVSIVLPVFNGAAYLAQALDSVLAQSFTGFELICVDDCSTDATPEILANYAQRDSRIRVIRNAANKKLPGSLNVGFAAARADWLSWTSDDNILLPDTLAELVKARDAHPAADIIHADYRVIDPEGTHRQRIRTGPADHLPLDNTIGCCFLYRREVDARLGGYDESLFGMEDYDFWLRAWRAGFTFHHLPSELYLYRRHPGSLTDQRARHIQQLVHDRLLGEVEALPASAFRARARARLATRDTYTFRPAHLLRAFGESPMAVLGQLRAILTWLRISLAVRLKGSTQ